MKNIQIDSVIKASDREWDEATGAYYSTYFHTREWAEIFKEYNSRLTLEPKQIIFSDKKSAIIPFVCQKEFIGLIKRYFSSPAGTFGGWVSHDELSIQHAKLLVKYMKRIRNLIWRENPYDPNLTKLVIPDAKEDYTQAIDLRQGFKAIYNNWTKGHFSAVKKAQREGVLISQAKLAEEWGKYYEVYKESFSRWGDKATSFYEWSLFEILFHKQSDKIKLWIALYKNKVISGALCFYHNKHVVYWHGAAYEEYFHLRSSNLLQYEIIKDACTKGYWWYDFNPSGGHEGVRRFKKGFGAKSMRSFIMNKEAILLKSINKIQKLNSS